jgi:pilus assembly protein FimV
MVRKLALAVALALTAPSAVNALGLGNIKLNSALNQPLDAEIELVAVRPGETEGLRVGLAPTLAFERAGLERPFWLTQFSFSVQEDAAGRHYIRVSSTQPVREPFVSFLLEANYAQGRLLREYTLLLDPPVLAGRQEVAVSAPATAPTARAVERPSPAAPPATVPGPYGPVKANETLWTIAQRLRPDDAVSMEQMMLALVRANPDAFVDGNINRLKAGAVLRAPEPHELTALSRAAALQEARRQNEAWHEERRTSAAPRTAAAAEAAAPEAAPVPEPLLKIVAPPAPEAEPIGEPSPLAEAQSPPESVPSAELEAMQAQLALADEAAAMQQRENEELRARLTELETQMANIQRLVTLKDQELAVLQDRLRGAADEPSAGGLVRDLLDNAAYLGLGGAVLALLGLLGWLAARRRRMSSMAFQESILGKTVTPASEGKAAAAVAAAAVVQQPSSFFSDPVVSELGSIHSDVDEIDPLAEADVYVAYGRYQQARELIDQAIQKEPGRSDLRLKMLEILFAAKDPDAFETEARTLSSRLGERRGLIWERVAEMGRELCPASTLFTQQSVDPDTQPDHTAPAHAVPGDADPLEWEVDAEPEAIGADNAIDFEPDWTPAPAGAEQRSPQGVTAEDLPEDFPLDLQVLEEAAEQSAKDTASFEFDSVGIDWEAEPAADGAALDGGSQQANALDDFEDLFTSSDEVGTKLDLAKAYMDMGDSEGARSILEEVLDEGNAEQKREAEELLEQLAVS